MSLARVVDNATSTPLDMKNVVNPNSEVAYCSVTKPWAQGVAMNIRVEVTGRPLVLCLGQFLFYFVPWQEYPGTFAAREVEGP